MIDAAFRPVLASARGSAPPRPRRTARRRRARRGPRAAASGQEPAVRLAAPEDCLVNPGCGEGLRATYALDVAPAFTPLTVADAGIGALDDGVAEVAVAFSTDPQVSRPDIVTLRDDRRMLGPDRLVPVLRRGMLRELSARVRAGACPR